MADQYDSICLTSVKNTVLYMMGLKCSDNADKVNPILQRLAEKKLGTQKCDRVVLYNPDAVALWLYQKYTEKFCDAIINSDIAVPMLSVMPCVTPVCFASMYTGLLPIDHGIMRYEKPVIKTETLFDCCIGAGKKVAIVSTAGDSVSKIFLERQMDYYIYDSVDEVNQKALELIGQDRYDLITIYNGDYDSMMHGVGPEGESAMRALDRNIRFYKELVQCIYEKWNTHNVFYGFMPDHGCHEIDGNRGSHGLEMEEDMNMIHFYGIKTAD